MTRMQCSHGYMRIVNVRFISVGTYRLVQSHFKKNARAESSEPRKRFRQSTTSTAAFVCHVSCIFPASLSYRVLEAIRCTHNRSYQTPIGRSQHRQHHDLIYTPLLTSTLSLVHSAVADFFHLLCPPIKSTRPHLTAAADQPKCLISPRAARPPSRDVVAVMAMRGTAITILRPSAQGGLAEDLSSARHATNRTLA